MAIRRAMRGVLAGVGRASRYTVAQRAVGASGDVGRRCRRDVVGLEAFTDRSLNASTEAASRFSIRFGSPMKPCTSACGVARREPAALFAIMIIPKLIELSGRLGDAVERRPTGFVGHCRDPFGVIHDARPGGIIHLVGGVQQRTNTSASGASQSTAGISWMPVFLKRSCRRLADEFVIAVIAAPVPARTASRPGRQPRGRSCPFLHSDQRVPAAVGGARGSLGRDNAPILFSGSIGLEDDMRHEVDFGDAPIRVKVYPSEETLGHTARLMAPAYLKPYVKRQNNYAADTSRPSAKRSPSLKASGILSYNRAQRIALIFKISHRKRITNPS